MGRVLDIVRDGLEPGQQIQTEQQQSERSLLIYHGQLNGLILGQHLPFDQIPAELLVKGNTLGDLLLEILGSPHGQEEKYKSYAIIARLSIQVKLRSMLKLIAGEKMQLAECMEELHKAISGKAYGAITQEMKLLPSDVSDKKKMDIVLKHINILLQRGQ